MATTMATFLSLPWRHKQRCHNTLQVYDTFLSHTQATANQNVPNICAREHTTQLAQE